MQYLKLPMMDSPVSVFDICQAHAQLESDYNVGGIVRERPSNTRRNESTGCQLYRMKYRPGMRWVEIIGNEIEDDDVRDIYLINVLKWGLPIDNTMAEFIANRYTAEFLNSFESWGKV